MHHFFQWDLVEEWVKLLVSVFVTQTSHFLVLHVDI